MDKRHCPILIEFFLSAIIKFVAEGSDISPRVPSHTPGQRGLRHATTRPSEALQPSSHMFSLLLISNRSSEVLLVNNGGTLEVELVQEFVEGHTDCMLYICKEYCQFQMFNASCPQPGHVIMMQEARYGRIHLGSCVTRDYGFLGCAANVLELLDRSCSGRPSCQFSVPTLRDLVQPCPKDLTSYLEASYTCVPVINEQETRCNDTVVLDVSNPSIYLQISGPSADTTPGLGKLNLHTHSCPVKFKASPGQRFDIKLYSFSNYQIYEGQHMTNGVIESAAITGEQLDMSHRSAGCLLSAYIIEGEKRHLIGLCMPRHREQLAHTTNGSSVSIQVFGSSESAQDSRSTRAANYLIQLEVTGCPDIKPPADARVERHGDSLVVRCNLTTETWYLTCKGTSWVGSFNNCSEANDMRLNDDRTVNKSRIIPLGLVIAVAIGIVLGITLGLTMLVTLVLYRRRQLTHQTAGKVKRALLSPDDSSLLEALQSNTLDTTVTPPRATRVTCPVHQVLRHQAAQHHCNIYSSSCPKHGTLALDGGPHGRMRCGIYDSSPRPDMTLSPSLLSAAMSGHDIRSMGNMLGNFKPIKTYNEAIDNYVRDNEGHYNSAPMYSQNSSDKYDSYSMTIPHSIGTKAGLLKDKTIYDTSALNSSINVDPINFVSQHSMSPVEGSLYKQDDRKDSLSAIQEDQSADSNDVTHPDIIRLNSLNSGTSYFFHPIQGQPCPPVRLDVQNEACSFTHDLE